jgi:hypothetical protein
LNNERVHHGVLDTRETTRAALFTCIEMFYERRRLHQTPGYTNARGIRATLSRVALH